MIRLDHITITVSNYVASRDWYASNFGLCVKFEDLKAGFCGLEDDGNTELILVQIVMQDRARDCSLSFQCESVHSKHTDFSVRDIQFVHEPKNLPWSQGPKEGPKDDPGSRDILGSLLHVHNEDSMDTSALQMALIAYQAECHKIEEKIAEIRAQLNGRSWRSRQASLSFSKADHGMPRANLDPDIAALPISRQAKYQKQWKRDGRCIQCGKKRHPDSAVYCSGCRAKIRVRGREWRRRATNAQRRNFGSISYQESGAVT